MTATQVGPFAATWCRLLPPGAGDVGQRDVDVHHRIHGPLPPLSGAAVIAAVRAAGLTGRGGAAFPTYRKLTAVAAGRSPVVVANGAEGEPASDKDKLLMSTAPHLVLDGLQLAARAVGAREAVSYVHEGPLVRLMQAMVTARAIRGVDAVPVTVVAAPGRFVSGQESAVAARLSGGPGLPRAVPPAVYEKGVRGRPTLVQNVETLAHMAFIARYGPAHFRTLGTAQEPGTMLFTVGGAVANPGVVEAPVGTAVRTVFALAGGPAGPVQAVLVGGYHGAWLSAAEAADLAVSVSALRPFHAAPGAGVLIALPAGTCGLVETARAVHYLADQSSGQCGPCLNGLPALAASLSRLAVADGAAQAPGHVDRLIRWVDRRGACHHPDGTARLVRSALRVFADEVRVHQTGWCTRTDARPVLPVPGPGWPR
jgi:NADH:ubiquinone oxidoreductase subunit F (NADH-binding)